MVKPDFLRGIGPNTTFVNMCTSSQRGLRRKTKEGPLGISFSRSRLVTVKYGVFLFHCVVFLRGKVFFKPQEFHCNNSHRNQILWAEKEHLCDSIAVSLLSGTLEILFHNMSVY